MSTTARKRVVARNSSPVAVVLIGEAMSPYMRRLTGAGLTAVAWVILSFGCNQPPVPQPMLSRADAVQQATEDAARNRPGLQLQTARVDIATADLIMLEEAARRRGAGFPSGSDPQVPVWWVTVQGSFRYPGGNQPDPSSPMYEAGEQYFVYDARTGSLLGSGTRQVHLVSPTVVPPSSN